MRVGVPPWGVRGRGLVFWLPAALGAAAPRFTLQVLAGGGLYASIAGRGFGWSNFMVDLNCHCF